VGDWALLGVGLAFVLLGVIILPSNWDTGITTIAFFGACTVVFAGTIARKLRFHKLRPISAEIVGGVPIRPSRAVIAQLGGGISALGAVLVVFGRRYPTEFVAASWFVLAVGLFLLLALAVGWLPAGYIQFDPPGITIAHRAFAFMIPWDKIATFASGEFNDNPVLMLWIDDLYGVEPRPPELRERVVKHLRRNESWVGAHVMIMTSQYDLELPLLMRALERYVADPGSRSELAKKRLTA
jgi:hypothetical protein